METVSLNANNRTQAGKGPSRRLRAEGRVPSVAYGLGSDTLSISVGHKELRDILLSKRGRNWIIDLKVGDDSGVSVMVKDYTVHPISRDILHVDFVRIDENTPVDVEVPFHTQGKSKGEGIGGTLLTNVRRLKLRCLPANIPDEVVFDVTELNINDVVKVGDLSLSEGVSARMPAERKVLTVAPPRVMDKSAEAEGEGEEGAEGEAAAEG